MRCIIVAFCLYSLHFDFAHAPRPLKIGVIEGLFSCDALLGIHLKHALEQVKALLVNLSEVTSLDSFQVMYLRKLHPYEFGVLEEVLLVLCCKRTEALLDEVKLIEIVLAGEERLAVDAFGHNAADGPDVDGLIVVVPADEQLWWPVPTRGHIVSHYTVGGNAAGKAQVADLDRALPAHEHVFGLHIPVDNVNGVHVGDAPEEAKGVVAHLSRRKGGFLQHFQQVFLDVLADEVDPALLAEGLLELNDVLVAEGLQDLDLAQDDSLVLLVSVILLELFDRHQLS